MADNEILLELTEAYLKALISEVAQLSISDKGTSTPFQELGIDSFRVLQIIKRLEEEFGTLPKTLLFENFNISDLSHYFVNKHQLVLVQKFANDKQPPGGLSHSDNVLQKPVEIVSDRILIRSHTRSQNVPILISEKDAIKHPGLGELVKDIFDNYKNEASASRGTRNIAPNLFIGSEKRGYFNYSRSKNIVLVYAYTGEKDYYPAIAQEMFRHCSENNLELTLFSGEQIESIGGIRFSATPFGVVSRILSIKNFSLQGSQMRRLRYLVSKFGDSGKCRTEEYQCGSNKETDENIARLIDQWCAPRTMVNPLIHIVKDEVLAGKLSPEHRLFLTYLDDTLQNAILISRLSPEDNGYLMDLEFYSKEMHKGGLEYAIVKMMEILAAEGCDMLSLGGTYGCKLAASSNADPELERTLDYLREKNIFNDEGNLQFKNKFHPEHHTVFLCRPSGSNPDNVTDIIMMIADPSKMQTSDEEHHSFCEPVIQVDLTRTKTEKRDAFKAQEEETTEVKFDNKTAKSQIVIEGEGRAVLLANN